MEELRDWGTQEEEMVPTSTHMQTHALNTEDILGLDF